MLRQAQHELSIGTRDRGLYNFTRAVEAWISNNGFCDGLLTLHVRHTSASLLIQENADPDVRADLERFFRRLLMVIHCSNTRAGRRRHARSRAPR